MLSSVSCEWIIFALKSIAYEGKDIIHHRHSSPIDISPCIYKWIPPARIWTQWCSWSMAQLGRNTYLFDTGIHNCNRRSYLWPLELVQKLVPERTWQQKQSDSLPLIIDARDNNHRQHSPIPPPRSKLTFRSLALCDRHYAHCYCSWPFPQTNQDSG